MGYLVGFDCLREPLPERLRPMVVGFFHIVEKKWGRSICAEEEEVEEDEWSYGGF